MTLDSLLVLLSDTAWKLVPIVLIVLLIYVILFASSCNHTRERDKEGG